MQYVHVPIVYKNSYILNLPCILDYPIILFTFGNTWLAHLSKVLEYVICFSCHHKQWYTYKTRNSIGYCRSWCKTKKNSWCYQGKVLHDHFLQWPMGSFYIATSWSYPWEISMLIGSGLMSTVCIIIIWEHFTLWYIRLENAVVNGTRKTLKWQIKHVLIVFVIGNVQ